jgi:hypothetical protein
MTPKQLKKIILETMSEVYSMSDEDRQELEKRGYTKKEDDWLRRQIGLQYDDEIEKDIVNLRNYNKRLNSTPEGRKMIQAFTSANGVTSAHGLGYISYAESELGGQGDANRKSIKRWLDKYGGLGKDRLSTVAWVGSPEDLPTNFTDYGNHEAITGGTGLLLKGYPVLVSKNSVSSQTLSSLPSGLVQHQAHSGIAKRGSFERPVYSLDQMEKSSFRPRWAAEVLLDNWSVVGCFVTLEVIEQARKNNGLETLFEDIDSTGLPCYVFSKQGFVNKL